MKETLYIRLRAATPESTTAAALWSPEGGLQDVSAPLTQVSSHAAGRRVVVFVPASDVRLATLNLPARSAQKVLQAAPYALEEQIADDVDTLHFALGPRQAADGYPVAIVARARMEAWLAALAQAGLRPDVLTPEQLCLPWSGEDRICVLAEETEVTARTGAFQGFSCLPGELPTYLQIADPENRYGLRVLFAPEFMPDFSGLGRPLELLPGHRSALEILVKHWQAETSINLLQAAYSTREALNRNWGPWQVPAALAAGWLVLALINHGVHAWRLGHEAAAQEASNIARFQALFPDEKKIVDLSAQAEQKMTALKSSGASQGLLKLLEPVAAAMTAVPGLALQNVQFRDGALYLNVNGKDLQTLESLRTWFGQQHRGASLEVQSANAGASGVEIRLKLSSS